MTRLHLDPLGGIAGDMFAAALLHARPDLVGDVASAVRSATGAAIRVDATADGALHGTRFSVDDPAPEPHSTSDGGGHHTHWSEIRARLNDGRLQTPVAARATAIFALLAEAEARVHGVAPDDVAFHEVGAVDSIADIVAAATLLVRLDVSAVSCAPVPLGHGRVDTAHGIMPVPAPATALLLEGLPTVQDGIGGERVTPTGAAILRHLRPGPGVAGTLLASGTGLGTRRLPGIGNCLRVLLFAEPGSAPETPSPHRHLAAISFEVDDQTGEDLATGIARLRATPGIHDVVQIPAIGKKGRLAVQLQVLADAAATESAIDACFRETATIGLRIALVDARALPRRIDTVSTASGDLRVKIVDRPGGPTAKVEADDLGAHDAATRARLRAEAAGLAFPPASDRA